MNFLCARGCWFCTHFLRQVSIVRIYCMAANFCALKTLLLRAHLAQYKKSLFRGGRGWTHKGVAAFRMHLRRASGAAFGGAPKAMPESGNPFCARPRFAPPRWPGKFCALTFQMASAISAPSAAAFICFPDDSITSAFIHAADCCGRDLFVFGVGGGRRVSRVKWEVEC